MAMSNDDLDKSLISLDINKTPGPNNESSRTGTIPKRNPNQGRVIYTPRNPQNRQPRRGIDETIARNPRRTQKDREILAGNASTLSEKLPNQVNQPSPFQRAQNYTGSRKTDNDHHTELKEAQPNANPTTVPWWEKKNEQKLGFGVSSAPIGPEIKPDIYRPRIIQSEQFRNYNPRQMNRPFAFRPRMTHNPRGQYEPRFQNNRPRFQSGRGNCNNRRSWRGQTPRGRNYNPNTMFEHGNINQIPNELLQIMWTKFVEEFSTRFFDNPKIFAKINQEDEVKAAPEEPKIPQYDLLLALEEKDDLVSPEDQFDCPICLMDYEPDDGVVLRDCLHVFCRDCLSQTVQMCNEVEVKCPQTECEGALQQREIRALISGPLFEKYLFDSFNKIEQQTSDTVHCKEPNCTGWLIVEGCLDRFTCLVCKKINCIKCDTIHAPLTCAQYQDQRRINEDEKLTDEQIKKMIDDGQTMRCPKCKILVQKIEGCDLVTCASCKTLICWATKGPRWGPNGQGDTSGGCRCGVNGIKCSPNCKYCH